VARLGRLVIHPAVRRLPRGPPGGASGDPAAVLGPYGAVSVFVTGQGGAVETTSQQAPDDNADWTQWTALGGNCAGSPVAYAAGGGRTEVLAQTTSGALDVAWQARPGGGWAAEPGPAGDAPLQGSPAVTPWPGGGLAVFSELLGGQVGYYVQQSPGGASWRPGLDGSYSGVTCWPWAATVSSR
jgi:hypothetical protein